MGPRDARLSRRLRRAPRSDRTGALSRSRTSCRTPPNTPTPRPETHRTPQERPMSTVTTTPEQLIADSRARIDAIDDRIIGLIQERMAVSAVIQEARITSGGRRVHLSREMEVLGHWSEALGKPGTSLAMTLLELCRGRV
ncbi:chorismate mutase [Streptomyces sp. NPDC089799]|uniref:chorismate mutase n=1 Tax=Streptomyces sp. NPDC089799 TaxID=3155066 RepID=UPI0034290A88